MGEHPFFIDDGEQVDERLPRAVHAGEFVQKLPRHVPLGEPHQHGLGTDRADGQLETAERQRASAFVVGLCELQEGLVGKMAHQPVEGLLAERAFGENGWLG